MEMTHICPRHLPLWDRKSKARQKSEETGKGKSKNKKKSQKASLKIFLRRTLFLFLRPGKEREEEGEGIIESPRTNKSTTRNATHLFFLSLRLIYYFLIFEHLNDGKSQRDKEGKKGWKAPSKQTRSFLEKERGVPSNSRLFITRKLLLFPLLPSHPFFFCLFPACPSVSYRITRQKKKLSQVWARLQEERERAAAHLLQVV